ncbi:MAG: hypothetical protein PHE04_06130, partial [Bacteroidales bacterium]|nr:hypothetical protein [Bacteroidales bacterium]
MKRIVYILLVLSLFTPELSGQTFRKIFTKKPLTEQTEDLPEKKDSKRLLNCKRQQADKGQLQTDRLPEPATATQDSLRTEGRLLTVEAQTAEE